MSIGLIHGDLAIVNNQLFVFIELYRSHFSLRNKKYIEIFFHFIKMRTILISLLKEGRAIACAHSGLKEPLCT